MPFLLLLLIVVLWPVLSLAVDFVIFSLRAFLLVIVAIIVAKHFGLL
jgi:hypothetical protein